METRVKIGIIGDYDETKISHLATNEAIRHCAQRLSVDVETVWLPTERLEENAGRILMEFDALWCAPGSPYKSFNGAISGIRYARENDVPFLGTCGGFQHAVLEYALNVLGIKDAGHQELSPGSSATVVTALACPARGESRMIRLKEGSAVRDIYGSDEIEEQYNCGFGLSPEFKDAFEGSGYIVSGTDENGDVRILEIPQKQFYITTLFQPQLTSTSGSPHKLILRYLTEAKKFNTGSPKS